MDLPSRSPYRATGDPRSNPDAAQAPYGLGASPGLAPPGVPAEGQSFLFVRRSKREQRLLTPGQRIGARSNSKARSTHCSYRPW